MASIANTYVAENFQQNKKASGLGPRTVIVRVEKENMTNDELNATVNWLTQSGGDRSGFDRNGPDAFVVAGLVSDQGDGEFVSGSSDSVILALQGTGTVASLKSDLEALPSVTTATVLAAFDQRVI